jgi:hypothetical protein
MDDRIAAVAAAQRGGAGQHSPHPSIARAKLCRHCGRVLGLLEHYSGAVCQRHECRHADSEQALQALRADAAKAKGKPDRARFPIVVVPHRAQRIAPVPAKRREQLASHLRALLASPLAADGTSAAARSHGEAQTAAGTDSASEPLGAPVCKSCRGFCCSFGGASFAFLDRPTLDRFASANPELCADGVVAAYVSRVPDRACKDSCLYHSSTGCVLPRSMRAALCNEYQCGPLKQGEALLADASVPGLFVVRRADGVIAGGEFVAARRRVRRGTHTGGETGGGAGASRQAQESEAGGRAHE